MMTLLRLRMKLFSLATALLLPWVCAESIVPIESVVMTLSSDVDSNPDQFPGEVLDKTDEFLRLILSQEYGDNFDRVSLSIISEGIAPSSSGGFVDTINVKGTSYWKQDAPSFAALSMVIKTAFLEEIDVYIETLGASPDPFLSSINQIEVENPETEPANKEKDTETPAVTTDDSGDSGVNLWVVALAVAATALCSFLLFCVVCICCLGDDEDENDDDHELSLKETESEETKPQTQESADDEENTDIENQQVQRMPSGYNRKLHMEGILDDRSLMSQDSSKFTYNPKSVTSAGEFTFQTHGNDTTDGNTVDNGIYWKASTESNYASGLGVELSVSRDFKSKIGDMDDDSLILSESENLSPTGTLGEMSDITDFQTLEERKIQQSLRTPEANTRPQSASTSKRSEQASSILDDLEDLSNMVEHHRTPLVERTSSRNSDRRDDI